MDTSLQSKLSNWGLSRDVFGARAASEANRERISRPRLELQIGELACKRRRVSHSVSHSVHGK